MRALSELVCWALISSGADAQEQADESPAQGRTLAGSEALSRQLDAQSQRESAYVSDYFRRWASPYYEWKSRMREDYGLSLGLSAHLLYQWASESMGSDDDALGGVYRFYGSWEAFARDSGHPGRLEWRVENRSEVGGFAAPKSLSGGVGAAALNTGFGYSDSFSTDLAVFTWTQGLNDRRAGFAIGRLAFDVYQDALLFQTFSKGFVNRAFVLNPTIATTGIGALGAVARGFVTDQFWIGGQIYDANAVSGEFDIDTLSEDEFLTNVEIGWTPSIERRQTDRVQLTYWEKDARDAVGVPSGSGWVVSASRQWTERMIAFTRFGNSRSISRVCSSRSSLISAPSGPWPSSMSACFTQLRRVLCVRAGGVESSVIVSWISVGPTASGCTQSSWVEIGAWSASHSQATIERPYSCVCDSFPRSWTGSTPASIELDGGPAWPN
ncbi:MAG: carbohydrate porin [bacterium]|nr:carbohydrate porin [bacterium]